MFSEMERKGSSTHIGITQEIYSQTHFVDKTTKAYNVIFNISEHHSSCSGLEPSKPHEPVNDADDEDTFGTSDPHQPVNDADDEDTFFHDTALKSPWQR